MWKVLSFLEACESAESHPEGWAPSKPSGCPLPPGPEPGGSRSFRDTVTWWRSCWHTLHIPSCSILVDVAGCIMMYSDYNGLYIAINGIQLVGTLSSRRWWNRCVEEESAEHAAGSQFGPGATAQWGWRRASAASEIMADGVNDSQAEILEIQVLEMCFSADFCSMRWLKGF